MPAMAKERSRKKTADRHESPFMIRLPEVFRRQLAKLKEKMRRPMTTEIQVALEEYLAKHNLWPPEENGDEE